MKKVLLALLLMLSGASAEEVYATVKNFSGREVMTDWYEYDENGNGWQRRLIVPAGTEVYLPMNIQVQVVIRLEDGTDEYFDSRVLLSPFYYIDAAYTLIAVGHYEEVPEMFGTGFTLGCTVSAAMLILHLVTLLKKPVLEG